MIQTRELEVTRWQLRVLTGPLRGMVHVVGERTGLGRSVSSDLQLIDTGVSRQHAMIVESENGDHVLIDLASANGTFVDGERVERVELRPGMVIKIVDTEIAYEAARPGLGNRPTAPVFAVPQTDSRTLRGTAEVPANNPDAPVPQPAAGPEGQVLAGAERVPVIFENPDGTEQGGQIIADIIEYRTLRSQCLKGGLADPAQRQHFNDLQRKLQQPPAPPPASQRAFCRFGCWFPAAIRFASGSEISCWVRDFGVDGAQIKVGNHEIVRDSIVWLAMTLEFDGRARSEVLTGRVAWVDGEFLGLAFTGAPRSEYGRYTANPQIREELDDTRTLPDRMTAPHRGLRLATDGKN